MEFSSCPPSLRDISQAGETLSLERAPLNIVDEKIRQLIRKIALLEDGIAIPTTKIKSAHLEKISELKADLDLFPLSPSQQKQLNKLAIQIEKITTLFRRFISLKMEKEVGIEEKHPSHSFSLDSAVQVVKAMQDSELESFLMGAEHSHKGKREYFESGCGSESCIVVASLTAESRFKDVISTEHYINECLESFFLDYKDHSENAFQTFKQRVGWNGWDIVTQKHFENTLMVGFHYYNKTCLLLKNKQIHFDMEHLQEIGLLRSQIYDSSTRDNWTFEREVFEENFIQIMTQITDRSVNSGWNRPMHPYFAKIIGEKIEIALMSLRFPDSYGKMMDVMNLHPPSLALILAGESWSSEYNKEAIYDIIDVIDGSYESSEETSIDSRTDEMIINEIDVIPWHAFKNIIKRLIVFRLVNSDHLIESVIGLKMETLLFETPALNSHLFLTFFQEQTHQSGSFIIAAMRRIQWSKITPLDPELTPKQERSIKRYTMDYSCNAFLRFQFWNKIYEDPEMIAKSLPNSGVETSWRLFREKPILNSLGYIIQIATLQEALINAVKKYPCQSEIVHRSLHFSSENELIKALRNYLPQSFDASKMEEGSIYGLNMNFEEPCFISTSENEEIVLSRNEEGISFVGNWNITFKYENATKAQTGVSITNFTDREQEEVLFRIGLKGVINGIIKEINSQKGGGATYILFCELLPSER